MNTKNIKIIITTLFAIAIFSFILPYPTVVDNTFYTLKQQQRINDLNEIETYEQKFVKTARVINVDWFDAVNELFKSNTTVKVIDVKTKREYFVQRIGGTNHAEVQTVNHESTEILSQINMQNLNCTRRPVWVEINGLYYAASASTVLHGYTKLNNGQGGHTCIHFLNSKTHGTNRIDKLHQKEVNYAYLHKSELLKYLKSLA